MVQKCDIKGETIKCSLESNCPLELTYIMLNFIKMYKFGVLCEYQFL